jgi:hypothetical protein
MAEMMIAPGGPRQCEVYHTRQRILAIFKGEGRSASHGLFRLDQRPQVTF